MAVLLQALLGSSIARWYITTELQIDYNRSQKQREIHAETAAAPKLELQADPILETNKSFLAMITWRQPRKDQGTNGTAIDAFA